MKEDALFESGKMSLFGIVPKNIKTTSSRVILSIQHTYIIYLKLCSFSKTNKYNIS